MIHQRLLIYLQLQSSDFIPLLNTEPKVYFIFQDLRIQLFHLKKYISTCRSAKGLLERLEKLPLHIIDQPHVYSMQDFMNVIIIIPICYLFW